MKTPLEYGKRLNARIIYDEYGPDARFFNAGRFTSVFQERALDRLSAKLGDCRDCPMCKTDIRHEEDHFKCEKFVEAYSKCASNPSEPCPMKAKPSEYLSAPYKLDDTIPRFESGGKTFYSPRSHGKSEFDKFVAEKTEGARIHGKSYSSVWVDEVGDISLKGYSVEEALNIVDDDLDEAVEFETNRENYDNFGSWN